MSILPQRLEEAAWRVIIIDDNPEDRSEVRRLLLLGGGRRYELIEAETGEAGVRLILDSPLGPPDCVILDYHLPDIDAPELLAALSGPAGEGVCPVVVVTGASGQSVGRSVLRAGAQDFIGKAWMTPESLTRAVENAVERWAMTRELRGREAQLRMALEATKTGIWTWDLRADAVTWTPECYDIHGVAPGDFDGSSAGFFRLVHADDRVRHEATVRAAIGEHAMFHSEFRVIRPGGEVLWVENLGRASHEAGGTPVRMIGTITDISNRKRIEEALAARERELQSVTHHIPDIIARFDRGLRHVFVSAAVTPATGRLPQEIVGKTGRELGMPTELSDLWDAALLAVFESGQPASLQSDFDSPRGRRHLDSKLVPEVGAAGEVDFVLAVTRDVTDRQIVEKVVREALDEAQRAVRTRDELVSLVSHDLKSPLNSVTLGISFLEHEVGAEGRAVLKRMARQTQRMNSMIDELVDAALLHAGMPIGLVRCEMDLVKLVRAVADEYRENAPGHRVEVRSAEASLVGTWDPHRLERVINNLLSNAVKYSPKGGRVTIELTRAEEGATTWALLRITDEGIGIGPSDKDRVFQWYSRGENALQTTIPGTGIGLAGSRDIVEQHGGSISVESEEGQGATFTVRLPKEPRPSAPRPESR